ncbi:MAG: hypothetical protein ACK6D2_20145 [Planctomycetota bacterium]
MRARLDKEAFDVVARIASEHNASKQQGGDAGWHRRRSERLPEPVLAAAFAQTAGAHHAADGELVFDLVQRLRRVDRRPRVEPQQAQLAVGVAVGVDARADLLAGVAALRRADRVVEVGF